jgi:hypothetical protein
VPKRLLPLLLLPLRMSLLALLGPAVTRTMHFESNVGKESLQTSVIEVHTISMKHVFI